MKQGFTLGCACAQPGELVKVNPHSSKLPGDSYTAGPWATRVRRAYWLLPGRDSSLLIQELKSHRHAQLQGGRKCNPSISGGAEW